MSRFSCAVVALAALVAAASAYAGANFTDPTQVNILERFNPDGSLYWNPVVAHDDEGAQAREAIVFANGGGGWRWTGCNGGVQSARWTFTTPQTLGKLALRWRAADHASNNFTLRDQTGILWSGTPDGGLMYQALAGDHASEYLELVCDPADAQYSIWELDQIGAFLAAGQTLKIDGTFNVFYQEANRIDGYAGADAWTDRWNFGFANPTDTASFATWSFSQKYDFKGGYLEHMFNNADKVLANAKLEVSPDGGTTWNVISAPADWQSGYRTFSGNTVGNQVRLSWDACSIGLSEIMEFQLFGAAVTAIPGDTNGDSKVDFADYLVLESTYGSAPISDTADADFDNNGVVEFADYLVLEANYGTGSVPEPMTLSLLALGGLALIRRR